MIDKNVLKTFEYEENLFWVKDKFNTSVNKKGLSFEEVALVLCATGVENKQQKLIDLWSYYKKYKNQDISIGRIQKMYSRTKNTPINGRYFYKLINLIKEFELILEIGGDSNGL